MPAPTNGRLRAVIVDDEPIVRTALRNFLETGGIEIVAAISCGTLALEAIATSAPDVALIDLGLPDIAGTEVIRQLAVTAPATQVLVVSGSDSEADVIESICAGASGYLLKTASSDEIVSAVRSVARGEPILSAGIASRLMGVIRRGALTQVELRQREELAAGLTKRESEVLRLIAAGKDNGAIASELYVSPHTVKNHVANILAKLHLENRIQAAVEAARSGLA
jgi:DNA-binding NarL/FixJ family response regulator